VKNGPTLPGIVSRPEPDPERVIAWTASAIATDRKLPPGMRVKREMRFVYAMPPRLN
jgi:hypothetical protein